jgi:hypothetical protein
MRLRLNFPKCQSDNVLRLGSALWSLLLLNPLISSMPSSWQLTRSWNQNRTRVGIWHLLSSTGPASYCTSRKGQLADRLRTTRRSIIRYGDGSRRIPGMAEVALQHLATAHIAMAGIVAVGEPIEPIPQTERIEVPEEHARSRRHLRVACQREFHAG